MKLNRDLGGHVCAGLILSLGACAGPAESNETVPAVTRLDRTARLTADVAWLADDAREGRRAGTAGEAEAALWLAARLESLGLEPAGSDGYVQAFEVPLPAEDRGGSWIELEGGARIADASGVVPLTPSAGGAFEGPLVFHGYGIVNGPREWNDYEAATTPGGVVMIVRGAPRSAPVADASAATETSSEHGGGHDSPNVEVSGGWGNTTSLFHKIMAAKQNGAAAVLVAQHPADVDEPLPSFASGRELKVPLPALIVTVAAAEALVPNYRELVAACESRAVTSRETIPFGQVSGKADVARERGQARNVLARLPGNEEGAGTVVIGAHFDHLGWGGTGSLAGGEVAIHNGADDNASGTAVVLELARQLAGERTNAGDVVFALWSGEELGLLGSQYWIEHPTIELADVLANINLDMVGRIGDDPLQILGAGTSPIFASWMDAAAAGAGLELTVSLSGNGLGGSDHQTFLKQSIPALHLFSGLHSDYHKPSDDTERFDASGAARTVDLCLDLLARMQAQAGLVYEQPAIDTENARRSRFAVRFGSVPEYSYDGEGLLLAGTSIDSPAERAGLLEGDIIVQVGDIEVTDIYAFMYALQSYKPGDVVLTRFLRDGVEESVRVTLEASQRE